LNAGQGDKIGRIFASWKVLYFRELSKITELAQIYLFWQRTDWSTFWAIITQTHLVTLLEWHLTVLHRFTRVCQASWITYVCTQPPKLKSYLRPEPEPEPDPRSPNVIFTGSGHRLKALFKIRFSAPSSLSTHWRTLYRYQEFLPSLNAEMCARFSGMHFLQISVTFLNCYRVKQ
jgi:hypothetical protein